MNLDWLVTNRSQVKSFLEEPAFYSSPLRELAAIRLPFERKADCEKAFVSVRSFLRSKRDDGEQKETLLCCFSLAMLQYLVVQERYTYEIQDITTEKGNLCYPVLISRYLGNKEKSNVISATYRAMLVAGKRDSFKTFYWYLSAIPPLAQV
ncbi:hypothetical protein [Hymenobacter sp. GOD-10R]|uniref:hypothetical protein n=1 Tax=Hymenobacter sp. GOD-10R TaxID=3093922 RepID=UPI002D77C7DE|nr:hypothetical protein [Hymenobacter sp. GOD-10R]WRQ31636.1 hypothetical protein SD425_27780 [Hymenobacter sp. GOD-10R]